MPILLPILLLVISNCFMTVAWYGNLRFPDAKLLPVIFISWGIAFAEYCFAVPANRFGFAHGWSAGQLKIAQEVITLLVFFAFAAVALKEPLGWRQAGAFSCLVGAVAFMFAGKG